ncbi:endo alpha-1,4 polygalactosaminidase [Actinoplanes palleronii]|uniref:Glycoside-hydrolase family GH114 TIM-barrel domain-containing protein n=1 Tax=Actinoplanes palleronii TaxID=113570 RepID=A0ABQ4BJ04_9ACTN|nr:endo alpha-1,4 polygalactosaminidase [Actinoplanes palleronii]GIE70659.1 hypothetical protein Apa02nite_067670 [Actinoplanes palleronii]
MGFINRPLVITAAAVAAALAGGVVLASSSDAATTAAAAVTAPPANATFDYQIGGAYTPPSGVTVVSRDRTATVAPGIYNICYLNAFQTQPDENLSSPDPSAYGTSAWWKKNHPDLLLKNSAGAYVEDKDWHEFLFDISTAAKRDSLMTIVGGWIDGCASAGYRAIEPDNLDSWQRSGNLLTSTKAVSMATALATRAHAKGLAIAQKNAGDLGSQGKTAGLDFAIVEECGRYTECDTYTSVYGTHMIDIEYNNSGFSKACSAIGATVSVVRRDVEVVPAGSGGYQYDAC